MISQMQRMMHVCLWTDSAPVAVSCKSNFGYLIRDGHPSGFAEHVVHRQSNMRPSAYRQVLDALRESVNLQPRNANGGLWYYADPQPPEETYRNLSYSDGMYGFAPFATLWGHQSTDGLNLDSASEQFAILYRHVLQNSTGLIVHGYDASKKAPWANRETGASPIVWGRSMGWYLAGLIDSLEIADMKPELCSHDSYRHMKAILCELCRANVAAALRSANRTGIYGVWQVVDRPGEDKNFVEASATALITYVLAKAMRLGYLGDLFSMDHAAGPEGLGWLGRQSAESPLMSARMVRRVVQELYHETVHRFVVENSAGLLEYHGTSALASLEVAQLDYNVSVRTGAVDSLIC